MKFSPQTGLLALAASVTAQQVKFMPLGDSITEITCWRTLVWDQLSTAGIVSQVDFVGSMNSLPNNCQRPSSFDAGHEGHSGWTGVNIAQNYLRGWLQSTQPDVVQFMLGTNDAFQGQSTDAIINSYTTMVNLMRESNPNMKIIVDKVIPLSFNQAPIDAINARIDAWATGLNSTSSPIWIADCSRQAGFTTAMLSDGVHPNLQGDQFIARAVGPLVVRAIQQVIAENAEIE